MTNTEKISKIQAVQSTGLPNESIYYNLLEEIGDIQQHYYDYVSTNVDEEIKRLPNVDYHLCCCLLTLILREDHFCNSFGNRYNSGIVNEILDRMVLLLEKIG